MNLELESDIDHAGGHFVARSSGAWLRVSPAEGITKHRWVRLRYSSSYFDDPIRPLIRFTSVDGRTSLQPMNGPVLGRGEWTGRVPNNTVSVSISPVGAAGAFDFRLESVDRVARLPLVWRGLSYDREALKLAIGAKIINARQERWDMLKFAATATAFEDYDRWHARLWRPIDINGIDRPRTDWGSGPAIRLFMSLDECDAGALMATLSSLRAQPFRRWSLHVPAGERTPSAVLAVFRREMSADDRLREFADDVEWAGVASDFSGDDAVTVISPGDVIPDHALAVIAERLAGDPHLRIVYGDEDAMASDGVLHSPLFKPDWSPVFFRSLPYLGRLTCARSADIAGLRPGPARRLIDDEAAILKALVAATPAKDIGHIRRILYRRRRARNAEPDWRTTAPVARPVFAASDYRPEAAIVIPTRNRAALLAQCMKSLQGMTDYPRYKVVIVDNGSKEKDALALLRDLSKLPNVVVVDSPGPFNFSKLCNDGAAATASPVIVFLNNDTVIVDKDWLAALVKYAVQPSVGVVGAKLLFPDGKIEHAGVVLGHGGIAGHLYHRHPAAEPGYLGQLQFAREVAAVTAACIAVERTKFDAVGGFDAENLPVDLNDIDLCLRISEKGWATIWTPESVLYHLQSASRGFQFKPTEVYRKERDFFMKQWSHVVRDDRYFHPALSLYSHQPALA